MKRSTIHFVIALILLLTSKPVGAQTTDQITNVQITHTYGREITFSASVMQPDRIKEFFVFFFVEGESNPRGILVLIDTSGHLNLTYYVPQNPIRPFADITYWFIMNLKSGETITSQKYHFQYTDNRFPWQTLKSDTVEVNWYSGNMDFGKDALEIIHQSILRIRDLISISMDDPVQLYLYASQVDLQESLTLGGQASFGPKLQVLLVSIIPGADQIAQMEQQIPHELTHLILYRKTGNSNSLLPAWLQEGLATQVEISPNPNFDFALANAVEKQNLISIAELCTNFPQDPALEFLAYAQASSFTTFLYNKYGQAWMEELIQAYTSGFDCEQGVKTVLGKSIAQLEDDWLEETFTVNALWQTTKNFMPYLFILLLILLIPLLNKPKKQIS